jgi:two-component system sensor histidine kinase UhpB
LARRALPDDVPSKLSQSVQDASTLAMQTLETARNMSLALHPALLDDLGLIAALRWEIDRFEQRTGQAILFKTDLADIELQPELEITIYRIVIEALTNIARHAQASDIEVSLQLEIQQIALKVEDNGVGFDAENWFNSPGERQSLGLVSMRERAELLGGSLEIISSLGQGTTVRGTLPVQT